MNIDYRELKRLKDLTLLELETIDRRFKIGLVEYITTLEAIIIQRDKDEINKRYVQSRFPTLT